MVTMIEEWDPDDWERFWSQLLQMAWWVRCTESDADADMLDSLYERWRPLEQKAFPGIGERRDDFAQRCASRLTLLKGSPDLPSFENALRKSAYYFTFAWTHRAFDNFSSGFVRRASLLSLEIVGSLRDLSIEFVAWLSKHPSSLPALHWEAFEKIVREVLTSHGLTAVHVARQRGRSADIIAFSQNGICYLVECKRYGAARKVGIDIVNAVLGAAIRNGVEHSMLVTSSTFSADVSRRSSEWRDLNLELYDGQAVAEWLSNYRPRKDMGLWINPDSLSESVER